MRHISLELIDYQNGDPFPVQLEALVTEAFADIDNKKYKTNEELLKKSKHISNIIRLIKKRFNINIVFDPALSNYMPAAIIPFESDYLTTNDQFNGISKSDFTNMFQGRGLYKHIRNVEIERKNLRKTLHDKTGYINIKGARLGGYLSEAKHYLIINFFSLKLLDMNPREVTAVILHEVGHAFTGLETHHRLTTTNSTIMDIMDKLNKHEVEEAEYLYKHHFTAEDVKDAEHHNNDPIVNFYGKLARSYVKELDSQLLDGKYDETNFENLADSFAGRFNLGDALVTGLDKLHSRYGNTYRGTSGRVIYFTALLINVFILLFLLASQMYMAFTFLILVAGLLFGTKDSIMTYDNPKERYNRIRNGITNNLKNTDLPDDVVKMLLAQWTKITEILDEVINNKILPQVIADTFIPSNRSMNKNIEVQQLVENSFNNILFVKSAQVRVS